MKLLLIRHGEMAGDAFVCPASPVTGCLSPTGIAQARAAQRALRDVQIDLAFSSPYGRALQTAEIVLADRNVPLSIFEFLKEWMPNPALDSLSDAEREHLHRLANEGYAEETWKTDLGEGCYGMFDRICPPFLVELDRLGVHHRMGGYVIEDGAQNLSLAIFAHGGTLNTLLSFLLGVPPFPLGRFSFALTGAAIVEMGERRGIHHPKLVIPTPCG
jgi:broad specificity phosphatase PhoE